MSFKSHKIRPQNYPNFALKDEEYTEKWTDPAPEPRKWIQARTPQKQDNFPEEVLHDQTPNSLWITQCSLKAKPPLAQLCTWEKAHLSWINAADEVICLSNLISQSLESYPWLCTLLVQLKSWQNRSLQDKSLKRCLKYYIWNINTPHLPIRLQCCGYRSVRLTLKLVFK